MQKLIEQLLDYNRKQADSAVELENVELAPLVETVVSAHSLPARAKMMHTDVDLKATACLAEPMLLMSVLDNLYSNAVHYGAESGNICLRSSLHGARVYIDVINTGTPIPQEERAMIFEPFFQGSHQRKGAVKGSGGCTSPLSMRSATPSSSSRRSKNDSSSSEGMPCATSSGEISRICSTMSR